MDGSLPLYALIFAAISSLAALLTSFFVFFQVRQANQHNRISVLLSFQERFATEEMAKAIRLLYKYKKDGGEEFAQKFAKELKTENENIESVNLARRKLTNYYHSIAQALRIGSLDEELARTAMSKASAKAFLEICVPMQEAHYKYKSKSKNVATIRKLVGEG